MLLGLMRLFCWTIFSVVMFIIVLFALLAMVSDKAGALDLVIASTYWQDRWVATGQRFDANGMTVAHKFLPFGTRLTLSHGHFQAVVLINDRGPYIRGRTLDLTPRVKKQLRCSDLCRVRMASWPPLPKPRPNIPETAIAWGEEGP
jgi:hypothetical protein